MATLVAFCGVVAHYGRGGTRGPSGNHNNLTRRGQHLHHTIALVSDVDIARAVHGYTVGTQRDTGR